ncbi:hypothetical protein P154DRAFT_107409 [Amniculicola lignicola CBS 123094]|uniref:Uncharacterized protein n=1 Tax=Amniculicola lignicola CBS 123094 TaxID=1392246 RepID=A0A6A5W5T3_9PLEO|nr:hypothetical protein P154DRAFT_107409 [Amniculicola lignicola CBS 123094]
MSPLPHWLALHSAGAGGNYILDATNLLEFLPTSQNCFLIFISIWRAVGYMVTGKSSIPLLALHP